MSGSWIIMSTEECYEGVIRDDPENEMESGSYNHLINSMDIIEDTIEFSTDLWESEKEYFSSFLRYSIAEKEKSMGSEVVAIGLIGELGFWNGKTFGGKIRDSYYTEKILDFTGEDIRDIDVRVDIDTREIIIAAKHYDATHYFKIYLISIAEIEKTGIFGEYEDIVIYDMDGVENYKKIVKFVEPLKLKSDSEYFRV